MLHFTEHDQHFEAMLQGCWRRVAPGELLFVRLASTIGLAGRRMVQSDGDVRFLVDQALLLARTHDLGARLVDPLKTTVVQDARCTTTWVLEQPSSS